MALSSHLDPALTPIKSPNFFRRDAYARTYACLSAYLPTIDIWNEYKNQNPETLEKPWNTLRKLYQDSNPDISDLTAAIPYTVFPSGLLCHHGRNISFCHDNYRDFFAAFHIANVVYGLCNGINLAALSPDAQEVFLLQLETLDNSILFDAISILRQYFGLSIYDISAQDTTDLSDTCAQIALPAILIRLLDAVIRRGELSKNKYSQLCQLRSTLCERFVLSFKALDESDPLQTKYCLFFSLALSMLARDYRTGVAGTRDLVKCVGYAQQCINGEKKLNIPKADGYLQVALCLNARMEDLLNVTDTKMNGTLPFSSQLADAVREAVRDYHEGSMYKRDEAVRTFRRNLFPRWKPSLGNVLACCDIFQIILEAAYEKYVSAANQNNQNYQEIARLGYVSKAYLVLAAIGTSGGALNLLAQMLINQANQYESDPRIPFFRSHPDIGAFVQQHAASYGWHLNDNYALAYRVLQSVCGIQRGSQPYSHMKKAELVLKGYVSELIALSTESNVQVIVTTHSAVLVNALDFKNIRLICADGSQKRVEAVRSGQLPFPSLNEVNYLAFSEISEGYHDELYGYLEEQGWLNEYKQGKTTVPYKKISANGTTREQQICMTEYIRHQIHHPENTYNARFNDSQLRRSIEDMRAFVTSKAQTPETT